MLSKFQRAERKGSESGAPRRGTWERWKGRGSGARVHLVLSETAERPSSHFGSIPEWCSSKELVLYDRRENLGRSGDARTQKSILTLTCKYASVFTRVCFFASKKSVTLSNSVSQEIFPQLTFISTLIISTLEVFLTSMFRSLLNCSQTPWD